MSDFIYSPPADTGLDIIYQDADLLVVNKPSELLSVPGRGEDRQDCLISRVQQEFPDALVVHRLDLPTSGLVLMARGAAMQAVLNHLFQQREVSKCYMAMVAGKLMEPEGIVDLPLITDWPNRPKQKVDHESGKPSQTEYQVISFDEPSNQSRIKLSPITGRSHQLRVHMMALGHPIVGDRFYAPAEVRDASDRLQLHATRLSFIHPNTDQLLDVNCQPDSF